VRTRETLDPSLSEMGLDFARYSPRELLRVRWNRSAAVRHRDPRSFKRELLSNRSAGLVTSTTTS